MISAPALITFKITKLYKQQNISHSGHLKYSIFIHGSGHVVQQGISKGVLKNQKSCLNMESLVFSSHLYVHILFTEEVKEAGHHLDILDLDNNISQSLFTLNRAAKKT